MMAQDSSPYFQGPDYGWTEITQDDIFNILTYSGVSSEDKQQVAGSIVVSLINLYYGEQRPIELNYQPLINSIQFGCQLGRRQIRKILTEISKLVKYHKKLYPMQERFAFIEKGYFIITDTKVKFVYKNLDVIGE